MLWLADEELSQLHQTASTPWFQPDGGRMTETSLLNIVVLMQCGGVRRVPHQVIMMNLQEVLSTIKKTYNSWISQLGGGGGGGRFMDASKQKQICAPCHGEIMCLKPL